MGTQEEDLELAKVLRIGVGPLSPDAYLFSAGDVQAWRWQKQHKPGIKPPEAVIFCMQPALFEQARRRYSGRRVKGFLGDCYLINKSHGKVALASGFGIGAPAAAVAVEEYAAFGVRSFVAIGTAGALQPALHVGGVVLCERAVRGEGTSGHYLPVFAPAAADPEMLAGLYRGLSAKHVQAISGVSWTTDAPFRETRIDADRHREDGVQTVEMEAAAIYAASESLGAKACCALIVADRLLGYAWEPPDNPQVIHKIQLDVLSAAISWLTGETA